MQKIQDEIISSGLFEQNHILLGSMRSIRDTPNNEIHAASNRLANDNQLTEEEIERLFLYSRCIESSDGAWAPYVYTVLLPILDKLTEKEWLHLYVHAFEVPEYYDEIWASGEMPKILDSLKARLPVPEHGLMHERIPEAVNGFVIDKNVLIKYVGNDEHVVIPEAVLAIDAFAFEHNSSLKTVTFPTKLYSIGKRAFADCSALKEVIIPESVIFLRDRVFAQCSKLKKFQCLGAVSHVAEYLFWGCTSLERIEFGPETESISDHAFEDCKELRELVFPNPALEYSNVVFKKYPKLADENGHIIFHHTYYGYHGKETKIVIPDGITEIDSTVFTYSKCTEIILPESLQTIGPHAFGWSELSHIEIPKNVHTVGGCLFHGCKKLKAVSFSDDADSITVIGDNIFFDCNAIEYLHMPPKLMKLADVNMKTIAVMTFLTNQESYSPACRDKWVRYLSGKSNRIKYGKRLDSAQNRELFEVFAALVSLTDNDLKQIRPPTEDIPQKPEKWEAVFFQTNNGDLNGEIVTYQGEEETIVIPAEMHGHPITDIAEKAFRPATKRGNAKNLRKIKRIVISEGIRTIGPQAFEGCKALESVVLPNSLTGIGNNAFAGCQALTDITLPDGVKWIGSNAFEECVSLRSISIPCGVEQIEDYTFSRCSSLTHVQLNEGLKTIGRAAFISCKSLKEIRIPKSMEYDPGAIRKQTISNELAMVKSSEDIDDWMLSKLVYMAWTNALSIKRYAFCGCTSLETICFPKGMTMLPEGVVDGCHNLKHIEIPCSVIEINENAFSGCKSIQEISIPEGVVTIYKNAFHGCNSLSKIDLPESCQDINPFSFPKSDALTLYVKDGSYAERFAVENGFTYVLT